jgi:hypothetical protein
VGKWEIRREQIDKIQLKVNWVRENEKKSNDKTQNNHSKAVTIKKKYIKGNGEKRKREISDQKTMK